MEKKKKRDTDKRIGPDWISSSVTVTVPVFGGEAAARFVDEAGKYVSLLSSPMVLSCG